MPPGRGLRLRGARPLPVEIEARRVPVGPEIVDNLWRHYRAQAEPLGLEPASQLTFRPEGRDVRSRVADVVPELARRYQEVNDARSAHGPLGDLEAQLLSRGWRVRAERAAEPFAKEREDRQAVPNAVREPPPLADGDNEIGLDPGERVSHPN